MTNKIVWIGTKESDIHGTNSFFSNSITCSGSGKNGNFSYSTENDCLINYNQPNKSYIQFQVKNIQKAINNDCNVQFMYYNPWYAYQLDTSIREHVCCLNDKSLMDLIRSKCEMRTLAAKYIPIVPFQKVLGEEINKHYDSYFVDSYQEYILQENISSGGDGTYIINNSNKIPNLIDENSYLISAYYKMNIPLNINFIVFDDDVIIFPPSIQLIKQINSKLLFMGSDYHSNKILTENTLEKLFLYTTKLANVLKDIGYRGICGFDFLMVDEHLMFLECNPRFQASSFLINIALTSIGCPSVQELNYQAFMHKKAPVLNTKKLSIPYSCVSYIYIKYLNNSVLNKELYSNPNIYTIFKDGFSDNVFCENDAYLYRVVFDKKITDISSDGALKIYDNLMPADILWYKKIIEKDLLALKISLLNQGITISQDALRFIKEQGGIKESVFDSIDLILEENIIVNCPYQINYTNLSPFSIKLNEGILELYYYNSFIESVTLEKSNPYSDKKTLKNKIPYKTLSYLGGDRLRIHHTDICYFKENKIACSFCNLPVRKYNYELDDIYEIIDFYLQKDSFRHILIGGGSENPVLEATSVLQIVKYIRSKTTKPIYLMCLPIEDRKILKELYDSGVTEIGFNIEIWSNENAKRIMPGKSSFSRSQYFNSLVKARKIWKEPYAVRTLLIVGLEKTELLKDAVTSLCEQKIMPILSVFRPLPDSAMVNVLPPSNEYLYNTYIELDMICRKYMMHLGPQCIPCQNNTLALPW